jgi:opacity protein-like surface antigen
MLVLPACSNADRVGYYVGGDAGNATAEVPGGLPAALPTAFDGVAADLTFHPTTADREEFTYGACVGYRYSAYLAVEAQYVWLGEYALAADVVATDGGDSIGQAAASWHAKGPAVSVLGSWPLASRWDVYARAGALWAEMDATLQLQGVPSAGRTKARTTTTELIWGIGAAYQATPQWTVRVEYQQVPDLGDGPRSGEFDVERYTLGWVYSY